MKIKDVKIGMKVIGNDLANKYIYTKKGWVGVVECIQGEHIFARGNYGDMNYCLDPKAFDKYEGDEEVLKVYRGINGYYVVYNGQIVASSRCHPHDKFNEEFGLNLALRRFCNNLKDRTIVEERKVIRKIVSIDDFI